MTSSPSAALDLSGCAREPIRTPGSIQPHGFLLFFGFLSTLRAPSYNLLCLVAMALMSIQSVKGVEVGDGFATSSRPGSKAHDEIVLRQGRIDFIQSKMLLPTYDVFDETRWRVMADPEGNPFCLVPG